MGRQIYNISGLNPSLYFDASVFVSDDENNDDDNESDNETDEEDENVTMITRSPYRTITETQRIH